MARLAVQLGRLALVLSVATLVAVAVTLVVALLGHWVLVGIYGPDLAPIDDTLPMTLALWTSYGLGAIAALIVILIASRRRTRREQMT